MKKLIPIIILILIAAGIGAWYTSKSLTESEVLSPLDDDARVPLDNTSQQKAPVPSHAEALAIDSGIHENRGFENRVAFRETIKAKSLDAPWVRLHLSQYNLGKKSYITVLSLKDRAEQRLDAETLEQWSNSTAFFNGDAVEIILTVAPGESNIFFQIKEITVGDLQSQVPPTPDGSSQESEQL